MTVDAQYSNKSDALAMNYWKCFSVFSLTWCMFLTWLHASNMFLVQELESIMGTKIDKCIDAITKRMLTCRKDVKHEK